MAVREYEAHDEAEVIALWNDVFGYPEARTEPRRVLQRKLDWDSHLLVAVEQKKIAGTIMVGYDGHRGWLYRLAVAEPMRRLGIGRELVRAAEALLAHLGCAKVNLQLHAHNAEGVKFWQSVGYHIEERISMARDLSGAPPGGC